MSASLMMRAVFIPSGLKELQRREHGFALKGALHVLKGDGVIGGINELGDVHAQQFVFGIVATKIKIARIVSRTGSMREQMPHRDVLPRIRRVSEVLSDRIRKIELARFHQHHHRRGRKLFAHRAGLENRLGPGRRLKLDVCQTIALSQNDFSILDYCERSAGNVLTRHFRLHEHRALGG